MYRRLLLILPLLVMFMVGLFSTPSALARPGHLVKINLPLNCSSNCPPGSTQIRWSGTAQGGAVDIEYSLVDKIGDSTNNNFRMFEIRNSSTGHFAQIGYGVAGVNSTGPCGGTGGFNVWYQYDDGSGLHTTCDSSPSLTQGSFYTFGISKVHGTMHTFRTWMPGQYNDSTFTFSNDPDQIDLEEWVDGDGYSGTMSDTAVWDGSRWFNDSQNKFIYQTTGGTVGAANPPQHYWVTVPAPGNSGGAANSCAKANGLSTC